MKKIKRIREEAKRLSPVPKQISRKIISLLTKKRRVKATDEEDEEDGREETQSLAQHSSNHA